MVCRFTVLSVWIQTNPVLDLSGARLGNSANAETPCVGRTNNPNNFSIRCIDGVYAESMPRTGSNPKTFYHSNLCIL